jgi:hypothetical protein
VRFSVNAEVLIIGFFRKPRAPATYVSGRSIPAGQPNRVWGDLREPVQVLLEGV